MAKKLAPSSVDVVIKITIIGNHIEIQNDNNRTKICMNNNFTIGSIPCCVMGYKDGEIYVKPSKSSKHLKFSITLVDNHFEETLVFSIDSNRVMIKNKYCCMGNLNSHLHISSESYVFQVCDGILYISSNRSNGFGKIDNGDCGGCNCVIL